MEHDDANGAERSVPLEAPYEPHEMDPGALQVDCPVCPARVGAWCGGIGDTHREREAALADELSATLPQRSLAP